MKKFIVNYTIKAFKSLTITAHNKRGAEKKTEEMAKLGYDRVEYISIDEPRFDKLGTLALLIEGYGHAMRGVERAENRRGNDPEIFYIKEREDASDNAMKYHKAIIDFMMENNHEK
jgi:hypothetical protein